MVAADTYNLHLRSLIPLPMMILKQKQSWYQEQENYHLLTGTHSDSESSPSSYPFSFLKRQTQNNSSIIGF